ncbi:MAG: TonB-dependent receptor [Bacteroidia bacterium]|nr:TonB-dependent receptor [Bacteroidia bacterium]MDW8157746.1 TonB-dependent receptor [Bacteroidia bacterium]
MFLFHVLHILNAQEYRQNIRGVVRDMASKAPIAGAAVVLLDTTEKIGAYTDEEGQFLLEKVRVGRITLQISMMGYEDKIIPNLLLTTGKELIISIELKEKTIHLEKIVILGTINKNEAVNSLAIGTARSLSMEEANRFAGSLADPTRMVANFAGVNNFGDSRNDIVIRGNSPLGLIWRLEGLDVPNPNHFATQGSNGGPISILNNNLLANSDFYTGAFPAEYSNGLSGAFDIRLRNGNPNRREMTLQIGFNGVEIMAEGPFSKKSQASYLVSYRYSTLDFFNLLGITFGDLVGIPRYQDLNFLLHFPTSKIGQFRLFGMGGVSNIDILESKLSEKEWQNNTKLNFADQRLKNRTGVLGISHTYFLTKKTYLKTIVGFAGVYRILDMDTLAPTIERRKYDFYQEKYDDNKITFTSSINHKFNAQHLLRAGYFVERIQVQIQDSVFIKEKNKFEKLRDYSGSLGLLRLYGQWQWVATDKLTFHSGGVALYKTHNQRFAIEPRISIIYSFSPQKKLSFSYGLHHQIQPYPIYFAIDSLGKMPNKNLGFSRSHHFILSHDWSFLQDWRLKVDLYYQQLGNIPVDSLPSSFSMLNQGAGVGSFPARAPLHNAGTGRNYGIELTLEKFFSKNYYVLITSSVFDSRYKASNQKEYNTLFNNHFIFNILAGTEWAVGKKKASIKGNMFFADFKITTAGGLRYTPIDIEASRRANYAVFRQDLAFSRQHPAYFRADIKAGYRWNAKRISQELSITIQNVTNHQNILFETFNPRSGETVYFNQLGFFPVTNYRVTF